MWFCRFTFVLRLRCKSDDFLWSSVAVLKLIQLETISSVNFLFQRCVLASWSDKEEMHLGLLLENGASHVDAHTLTHSLTS